MSTCREVDMAWLMQIGSSPQPNPTINLPCVRFITISRLPQAPTNNDVAIYGIIPSVCHDDIVIIEADNSQSKRNVLYYKRKYLFYRENFSITRAHFVTRCGNFLQQRSAPESASLRGEMRNDNVAHHYAHTTRIKTRARRAFCPISSMRWGSAFPKSLCNMLCIHSLKCNKCTADFIGLTFREYTLIVRFFQSVSN